MPEPAAEAAGSVASSSRSPAVLDLPSHTTAALVLLGAAICSTGLFFGSWVYFSIEGSQWLSASQDCASAADLSCLVGERRRLGWFAVAGVFVTLAAIAAGLALVPTVFDRSRRSRRVVDLVPAAGPVFEEICRTAHVSPVPELRVGGLELRDAYTYGRPGRYRIVVPPSLVARWSEPELVVPVLQHELAHVRHRDVRWGWFTLVAWYVVGPLLTVPFVLQAVQGQWAAGGDYLLRAGILLTVTWWTTRHLLRSREIEADLRAASVLGTSVPLDSLLAERSEGPTPQGFRRLRSFHPDAATRRAHLARPSLAAHQSFVDAATAGYLAWVLISAVGGTVGNLLSDVDGGGLWALGLSTAGGAMVLGAGVGGGLVRAQLVSGRETRFGIRRLVTGLAAGSLLGHLLTLNQLGSFTGRTDSLLLPLVAAGGAAAAAAITVAVARSAADTTRVWSPRVAWRWGTATSVLVFAMLVWSGATLQLVGMLGTAGPVRGVGIVFGFTSPAFALAALVLAVSIGIAGLWTGRGRRTEPTTRRRPTPITRSALRIAVLCAVGAVVVDALLGVLMGRPEDDVDLVAGLVVQVAVTAVIGVLAVLASARRDPAPSAAVLGCGLLCTLLCGTAGFFVLAAVTARVPWQNLPPFVEMHLAVGGLAVLVATAAVVVLRGDRDVVTTHESV